jgi:hypothetical protein
MSITSADNLGRDVVDRSDERLHITLRKISGQAKVDQLDIILTRRGAEQDFFGFQVAMADVLGMHVANRTDQFMHYWSGLLLTIPLMGYNPVEQIPTLAELRHDMNVRLVLINLVKLQDVRVIQRTQD